MSLLLVALVSLQSAWATNTSGGLWFRAYGGTYSSINSVKQTTDGGFVAAGYTASWGAGSFDALVLRLDPRGRIVWQRAYGGLDVETAQSVEQTSEGGFIVAGLIASTDNGWVHPWVLKLDTTGNVVWQKSYGGTGEKGIGGASVVRQTFDGGFIVGASITQDPFAGDPFEDVWVLKLDLEGNIVWQIVYGGQTGDSVVAVEETLESEFIVGGVTGTLGDGSLHGWVIKLNLTGGVVWQKAYTGQGSGRIYSMRLASDGRIVAAGPTDTFGSGLRDAWVLALDSEGRPLWQKAIGTWGVDYAFSVEATLDGGIVVGGLGYEGALLVKLSRDGNLVWKRDYGLIGEEIHSVIQTSDGGLVIGGNIGVHQRRTGFVAKLGSDGLVPGCRLNGSSTSVVTDTTGISTVETEVSPRFVEEFNTVIVTAAESTRNNGGGMLLCLGR